jgi:valyl-tRNA synthetase
MQESTKPVFKLAQNENDLKLAETVWNVLRVCNENVLVMYHPFIPSLTEELWQRSNAKNDSSNKSILDFSYPSLKNISKFEVGQNFKYLGIFYIF